jgi:hypothetical protein
MSSAAPFDRHQLRSFQLAGTVALPSPFPEVGRLRLLPGGVHYNAGPESALDLVAVEHTQSNRVTITRHVALHDVAAVFFVNPEKPAQFSDSGWYFGPEIGPQLEIRSTANAPALCLGIVYVREQAAVLMRVEVGMTAAESAEYYPPVVGERTDDHYTLQKDCLWFPCDMGPRPPLKETETPRFPCDMGHPPPGKTRPKK